MAEWKQNSDRVVSRVLDRINKTRYLSSTGAIKYRQIPGASRGWHECMELLQDSLILRPQVRPGGWLIQRAILDSTDAPLTKDLVLQVVRAKQKAYLQSSLKQYYLCTWLSHGFHANMKACRVAGCSIVFRQEEDPRFPIPSNIEAKLQQLPSQRSWVRVHVKARDVDRAASSALESLTLLRAFWNLGLNFGAEHVALGSRPAINMLLSGPVYTLHRSDGSVIPNIHWAELNYAPRPPKSYSSHWEYLEQVRKRGQKKLRELRPMYRGVIEHALRSYVLALDEPDYHTGFLKLWSVLEILTDTAKPRMDHAATVRRGTSLFDAGYADAFDTLDLLRERRNTQVHQSRTIDGERFRVLSLKQFVELLLRFHLNAAFSFRSMEEAGNFLDLPRGASALRRRREVLKAAIAMRSHWR